MQPIDSRILFIRVARLSTRLTAYDMYQMPYLYANSYWMSRMPPDRGKPITWSIRCITWLNNSRNNKRRKRPIASYWNVWNMALTSGCLDVLLVILCSGKINCRTLFQRPRVISPCFPNLLWKGKIYCEFVICFLFWTLFAEEPLGDRCYGTVARDFQGFRTACCPTVHFPDQIDHLGTWNLTF